MFRCFVVLTISFLQDYGSYSSRCWEWWQLNVPLRIVRGRDHITFGHIPCLRKPGFNDGSKWGIMTHMLALYGGNSKGLSPVFELLWGWQKPLLHLHHSSSCPWQSVFPHSPPSVFPKSIIQISHHTDLHCNLFPGISWVYLFIDCSPH